MKRASRWPGRGDALCCEHWGTPPGCLERDPRREYPRAIRFRGPRTSGRRSWSHQRRVPRFCKRPGSSSNAPRTVRRQCRHRRSGSSSAQPPFWPAFRPANREQFGRHARPGAGSGGHLGSSRLAQHWRTVTRRPPDREAELTAHHGVRPQRRPARGLVGCAMSSARTWSRQSAARRSGCRGRRWWIVGRSCGE
jgi:hypothetical protein